MADPDVNYARTTLRIAPWACALTVAAAAAFTISVPTPLNHLLWSAGLGAIWFVLVALVWRVRHGAIRISALLFFIIGHMVLRKRLLVDEAFFDGFQGILVSVAVVFSLMILLRPWLLRFARLEGSQQDG